MTGRLLSFALLVLACVRFAAAYYTAMSAAPGDFAATLPGAYAEWWNSTLWDSPDLSASWAFHGRTYLHGPTQFLTLFPIVFLDSYAAIARALLPIYGLLILASCVVLARLFSSGLGWGASLAMVGAVTLLYAPLLQALQQREFEVVMLFATVVLVDATVRERHALAGTLAGYIAGFKYLPVLYVVYFAAQRWWRAVAAFAMTVALLFGLARVLLGPLSWFFNNNVPGLAGRQVTALFSTAAFCGDWPGTRGPDGGIQGTFAGVRWGLCGWQARGFPIPPPLAYWLLALTVLGVAATTWWRLEHPPFVAASRRWRRMLEISLIATVAATFFYTHYYYLSVLVLPLNVLMAKLLIERRVPSAAMLAWVCAYVLLSAGVLPFSLMSRLVGRDWWTVYIGQQLYLYGELLLLGLLLVEYRRLTRAHPAT